MADTNFYKSWKFWGAATVSSLLIPGFGIVGVFSLGKIVTSLLVGYIIWRFWQ